MVLAVTACERQDPAPPLPPIRQITKAQFREELRGEVAKQGMMSDPWATPLTALHLMPSGESSIDAAIDTTVQSVAAYYDSTTKRISIVSDAQPSDLDESTYELSHELTHYLQDRSVALDKLERASLDSTDADTGLHALVEGEAVAISTRALTRFLQASPEQFQWTAFFGKLAQALLDDVAASSTPLFASVQDLPYWLGGRSIETMLDAGGRAQVRALFKNPPRSLGDWLSAGPPVARTDALDCGPPEAPQGFSLVGLDRFGIAGALALLSAADAQDFSLASKLSMDAVAIYAADTASGPAGVTAWRLRFDTGASAMEFAKAVGPLGFESRAFGSELLLTTSLDPSQNPLRDQLLDACPNLQDLEPAGAAGPAAIPRALLR